ncbi:MAG: acetate--CoA ligase, partial [Myxococcota bacterium]
MTEIPEIYSVPARVAEGSPSSIANLDAWRHEWLRARNNPDGFWLEQTQARIAWRTPPTRGLDGGYDSVKSGPFSWFSDGTLNITESCLDRHLETHPDKVAILHEGDEPGDVTRLTYRELHEQVCRAANAFTELGLKKGERVIIYMGMVPEAAVAMLACARLGAIHSVVFGGFSAEALRDRIRDCGAEMVITQDQGLRAGRTVPLKATADEACEGERGVLKMVVVKRTGGDVGWTDGRDVWWHEVVGAASPEHQAVECNAEDPLFILYTSGSTGKPKGVVHTCGGYITYASYTHQVVFDLRDDDVYACVADIGWITGHSYIVYGPLANGATTLMFESTPLYPDAGRYWDMVQRHKITVFYTAPTAIRALAAKGDAWVTKYNRSSLRVLGTVGEPINPEAWEWYHRVVGDSGCNIVDTWWQTETGGIMIAPVAPATPTKPGAASNPLPGILPVLVNTDNRILRGP